MTQEMENQEINKKEMTLVEKIDLLLKNQEMIMKEMQEIKENQEIIMKEMQEIKEKLNRKRNPNQKKTYVKIRAYFIREHEKGMSIFLLNDRQQGEWIAKSTIKKDNDGKELYDPNKTDLQDFYIENWVVAQKFPLPQKKEDKNANSDKK